MSLLENIPSYNEGYQELRNSLAQMLPVDSLHVFDADAERLGKNQNKILSVEVGQKAPDFKLTNAIGKSVSLQDLIQNHNIVLVFYRGSWCPYCNLALSQYQMITTQINSHNAKLIAISAQTPDESLTLKEKNNLQFEVLSDNGNMVARMYTTVFKNEGKVIDEMTKLGYDFNSYYSDDSNEIPVPAVIIINRKGNITFAQSEGGDYRQRLDANEIVAQLKKIEHEK